MTELSTTEANRVEQAANDYLLRCKHYGSPSATPKDHFEAGIDFALSHILPSRMIGFAEWVVFNYYRSVLEKDKWMPRGVDTNSYTTEQLLEKYNEYLK